LGGFEDEVCVVFLKEFGGDDGVDLRIKFVKVCEGFDWCDYLKINLIDRTS